MSRNGSGSDPNRKFVYDMEGRLWAEYNGAGTQVQREYIWLDDMPVAMIVYTGSSAQTSNVTRPRKLVVASM